MLGYSGAGQFDTLVMRDMLPDGAGGTRETLKHMREAVRRDKFSPEMRDLAQSIIAHVPSKDWIGELAACFNFVRTRIRYSLDINGVEVLQDPHVTLELGYGDCDDHCILLACLLELIGHACAFCAIGFEDVGYYSHVIVLCDGAGETGLIPMDTTEPHPMGWFPPGATCMMIAPIEGD